MVRMSRLHMLSTRHPIIRIGVSKNPALQHARSGSDTGFPFGVFALTTCRKSGAFDDAPGLKDCQGCTISPLRTRDEFKRGERKYLRTARIWHEPKSAPPITRNLIEYARRPRPQRQWRE